MGIANFFRPKYKHSDVKVRLEAVRALTSDETDILATVARSDKDAGVRRVAIEKIDEVDVLAEIAGRDDDRGVRDLAGSRAAEIWVTSACQDEDEELAKTALSGLLKLGDQRAVAEVASRAADRAVRQQAMAALKEPRALAELARSTSSPEVRQQVVARINDEDVLRALAVDTTVKELGLLAVDRIAGGDVLEQVAAKAKNKAVRQRARKKIDDLDAAEEAKKPRESDEIRRRRAEKSQLVREVEGVVEVFEWVQSLATVKAVAAAWAKLGETNDAALDERFERAVSRYHARREAAAQQVHQHEEALTSASSARRAAAQAFEERARERAAERRRDDDDGDIVNHAAMAIMKSQLAEEDAQRAARERENAARRAEREAKRAERVQVDGEVARAPRPDPAEAEVKREESAERRAQIARSLEALVDEMASLVESSDIKAIDRLLEQARTAFAQAGRSAVEARDQHAARYDEVRGKLVIRAKDLRESEDWKRFANVPKAEQLVALAKELADMEQPRLDILKQLQKTWKEIGPIPGKRSKELWEQFKAHTDAAFVKIKGAREVEDVKFAEAAKVKEALIAEAEAFADSTDWDATAAALKGLQQKWKETGHVPRKQGDELWKRFRAACDKFFERRKPLLDAQHEELLVNVAQKEALIARAEAVVARAPGEDGWGKAIGEIKDLGMAWREIGRVPRADVEPLWQRFRAACDGLFAKRDAARDAEADARRAELEALRSDMEGVLAGGDDVAGRTLALRRRVVEMTERDVEPSAELRGLYERMLRLAIVEHGEALRGSELDPVAMTSKRTKIISRAEALLPKVAPAVSADSAPADIAAQLKQAMQANSLFKGDGRDPYEVIEELRAEWSTVGPVVGDDAERQAARFAEVSATVLERAGGERPERPARAERGERSERGRGRDRDDRAARGDAAPGGGERAERGGRRERRERRKDDAAVATEAAITAAPAAEAAAPAPVVDSGTNKVAVAPAPVAAAPAPVSDSGTTKVAVPPPPAEAPAPAAVEPVAAVPAPEPVPVPPRQYARAATEQAAPPPVQVESAAPQVIVEVIAAPVPAPVAPTASERRRANLATQSVPVVATPEDVTTKVAAAPPPPPPPAEPPRRARSSTLPPGVVEKLDDEWDAGDAPASAAPTESSEPPAATPATAPTEAVDDGWE